MADTQVEICNMALGAIGISERIEAITDDNPEADACELVYDTILDKALSKFDWGFARRLITLTTEAGTPPEPWGYQYQLPAVSVMVRALRIDDQRTSRQSRARTPFTTYTNASGARILLTSIQDAKLWYTHRDTNVPIYPEWFVTYLSWELAAEIAGPLTSNEKLQQRAEQGALMKLSEAISRDAESEQEDREPEASWVEFRDSDIELRTGTPAHDYLP